MWIYGRAKQERDHPDELMMAFNPMRMKWATENGRDVSYGWYPMGGMPGMMPGFRYPRLDKH